MKRIAFALAAFAAPAAMAQTAPPPAPQRPVEHFAALPFMSGPELSPDGKRVAAKIAVDGKQVLAIMSLFEKGAAPTLIGTGDSDLNSWRWVNDDWLVVGIGAARNMEGGSWYLSRIAGVNRDGKTIKPIAFNDAAQDADDVLWIAEDGTPRLILAMQTSIYVNYPGFWPSVYDVDVSTGKLKRRIEGREGVMSWYADGAGTVRMGVGYSDATRQSRLLYRETEGTLFKTIDRADGRKDETLKSPALFLAEPGKGLAWGKEDGRDALYGLDLASLKLGEKIFSIPGYDLDGIVSNRTRNALAGVRYTDTRPRVHWFDPAIAKVQADLDKAVGEARVAQIESFSRDQQNMIVHVGAADRPGSYYFYNTAQGSMLRFADVSSHFKGAKLGPVRTIRYKARDGLEIQAILTLPPGREPRNLPLIVMPHGGPAVRDAEGWDWWAQFMADRGYAVIQPNYRGSTGFGSAFQEKGEGEWGLKMQDDLNDAITHLGKEGIADAKRVCMVGGSYGGYAAMRAAQRDGALYRCAVSFAGVSDLAHLARYDSRFLYGKTYRASLKEKAPDFAAVSPLNFPAQFSAPILLVHGKKDLRVPVKQSREMAEKLQKAGKTVRYVEQPEGDHHFSRQADRLQFLKELEAFLKEHNPA